MDKNYFTTLNTRPFLYQETKQTVGLLLEGKSEEEIKKKTVEENLYLLESKDRSLRFAMEILKRVAFLDTYLMEQLITADLSTSKGIVLYALLKKDQLFYEWMREVVREKFLVLDLVLLRKDTELFLEKKGEQSPKIKNWSSTTKKRLSAAYERTLVEAGMLKKEGNAMKLQRLLLDPKILQHLREKEESQFMDTLLGE